MRPLGWSAVAGWGSLAPLLLVLHGGRVAAAVDPSRMPPPPASPQERHDPDLQTCNPDWMLAAWQRQLQGYADQPAPVLERLRQLQRQMATQSLNRCIERGLISRAEARRLAAAMGLGPGQGDGLQSPSQRP